MKKSFKAITSLVLMVLVLMSLSASAFAAAPSPTASITFRGEKQGFGFQSGDMNYTATDLFDSFKNVMPGDNLTESISFTYAPQDAADCDFVNLYMKAVPHDETATPLTYSETFENTDGKDQANVDGQRDETVATMSDFLSQLTMTVKAGGTEIYNSTPDQTGALTDYVFIGKFYKGEGTTFTVDLNVPITLDNRYANRVGEVDWVFRVDGFNETQLTVTKNWSDGNASHANDSVTVKLLKDGKETGTTQVLNAANNWTYTFDKLDADSTWTVEEEPVDGYTPSYKTEGTTVTITNTANDPGPNPKVPLDITVIKKWSNDTLKNRLSSVTVTLYDGDVAYDTVRLSAANKWTYHWKDLNAYGNWRVLETNIPRGYVPSYSVSADGTVVTITNSKSLIQTGQLNWPVWVLGGAGVALVTLGGAMMLKKKRENDA